MTTDGVPLWFNASTGNYEYALLSGSRLSGSGIVAADVEGRSEEAKAYISSLDADAIIEAAKTARVSKVAAAASKKKNLRTTDYPTLGEQHSLVILVEFSNQTFTKVSDPKAFFTDMLNEEGFTYSNGANGSARDFYVASSAGFFTPTFDVVGPVTLSQNVAYYGTNDYYGNDELAAEMIIEACQLVDDSVDFSQYDKDGDGYVDHVYVFYAGYGEADGGNSYTIWPHSANVEEWDVEYATAEGPKIGEYSCSNEINYLNDLPAGIGTFVHEFGHVLGLVDHYDVYYGSAYYVDPGTWDTMATGSYNNDSNTPPLFSAFERGELGWLQYTDLMVNADTTIVLRQLTGYNEAYRVMVNENDEEYFVLENRQQEGWDAYLPGSGMLAWHIDIDSTAWENNRVNISSTHLRVDIVEADGITGSSTYTADPFPGTAGITSFDFSSWADGYLFGIRNVAEVEDESLGDGITITFTLADADTPLSSPEPIEVSGLEDDQFTLSWPSVEGAEMYVLTINQVASDGSSAAIEGYKYLVLEASDLEIVDGSLTLSVEDLIPETNYEVKLRAGLDNVRSEESTVSITTEPKYFTKRLPIVAEVSDVSATGFSVEWEAVPYADSYAISLSSLSIVGDVERQGYGFTNKLDSLPELWEVGDAAWTSISSKCGEAAPSLILSQDGDYVLAAYRDKKLSDVEFWLKADAEDCGTAEVDIYFENAWQSEASIVPPTTGEVQSVEFSGYADSVRISFSRASSKLYIDDIYVTTQTIDYVDIPAYTDLNVGAQLSYTFTDLDEGGMYGFVVYALSGEERSLDSERALIYLSADASGIKTAGAEAGDAGIIYDLEGRKLNSIGSAKGIYIIRYKDSARKVLIR